MPSVPRYCFASTFTVNPKSNFVRHHNIAYKDILFTVVRSYDGPLSDENALLAAAAEGLSCPEYVDLCRWLASSLKPLCDLKESLTCGPGETHSATFDS